MKQSYHVPIIRIVQQINEEMIWLCLQNYCQSSCAKIIKLTQYKHDLQLQLQKKVICSSRAHMTISTNFQSKIAEPEISYGRAL